MHKQTKTNINMYSAALNKEKNFDHKSKLHFIVIHYSAIHDINYSKNG